MTALIFIAVGALVLILVLLALTGTETPELNTKGSHALPNRRKDPAL